MPDMIDAHTHAYQDLDLPLLFGVTTQIDMFTYIKTNERTHQGKMCCGRTPMDTLLDGKTIWVEKNLTQI